MKESELITSKELLEILGLKNIKTLTRWHKEYKLVPPPIIKTHPSGRGKIAYWDKKLLGRFKLIKEKFDEGLNVDELRFSLGFSDEDIKMKIHEESVAELFMEKIFTGCKNDPDNKKIFAMLFYSVFKAIKNASFAENFKQTLRDFLLKKTNLSFVLTYIFSGYNPVLFVCGKKIQICPDFLVSHYLKMDTFEDIIHTFPLKKDIVKFIQKISNDSIDFKTRYKPKQSVIDESSSGRILEIPLYIGGLAGFKLIKELTTVVYEGDEND